MSWSDNLATVDAAVAGYFDEDACLAIPMAKASANAQIDLDPSRDGFAFLATIETEPSFNSMIGGGNPKGDDRQFRAVAKVCLTALVTAWPWILRQGDHIECNGVRYAVAAAPDRDGTPRIAVWLNKVKP